MAQANTSLESLFKSVDHEVLNEKLRIKGTIPAWIEGSFIRNGPGKFEVGKQRFAHWFDGFAVLHKFDIKNGEVIYSSRFLQSEDYKEDLKEGRIITRGFGTVPDPCASIFSKFFSSFSKPNPDNAAVSVLKIGERIGATSDFSNLVEFDLHTLDTKGRFLFEDKKGKNYFTSAAHPAFDPETKEFFNCLGELQPKGKFHFYKFTDESFTRHFIGSASSPRNVYFHSFGLTRKHFIFIEQPLRLNLFRLMFGRLLNVSYEQAYKWHPGKKMKYHVMNRETGEIKTYESDPYFFFHTVNSFEEGNKIVIDVCRYQDPEIIKNLYLDHLKENGISSENLSKLYRISIDTETGKVSSQKISDEAIELPNFDLRKACQTYQFVYGFGLRKTDSIEFSNQLIKIDNKTGTHWIWHEDNNYPSEPIFVPSPTEKEEDDGVLLSVVFDGNKGNSYLLVLDAKEMKEIGRAEASSRIPIGLHGAFYPMEVKNTAF